MNLGSKAVPTYTDRPKFAPRLFLPASYLFQSIKFFPSSRDTSIHASSSVSPPQSINQASRSAAIPSIPPSVAAQLSDARSSWADRCVNVPLVDAATKSRLHVYGAVHFAPHGGVNGLAEVKHVIQHLQPNVIAIEQPYDIAARAGLPYPEVIHHICALLPTAAQLLSGPDGASSQHVMYGDTASAHFTYGASDAVAAAEVARLRLLLPSLAQPARVGRDILDPFEVFGFYGGCDYVTRPEQLAEALARFGFLPGLEYATAAITAQELGVQVYSVDAPLRLQEKWAAQLVANFTLVEADLARRLQHDLGRAQALLPATFTDWDVSVAEAVRQMEAARQADKSSDSWRERGSGLGTGMGGGGPAGGPATGDGERAAGDGSLSTITAFKVSRAVAAGLMPYEQTRAAMGLQARLQPLKFAFFARKAKHLLLQVRDLCQRMSVRRVRVDSAEMVDTPAGKRMAGQETGSGGGGEFGGGSGAGEQVVLAIVGRQYVPYIEEMWANERSVLWHGDVPRTFSPSKIEQPWTP